MQVQILLPKDFLHLSIFVYFWPLSAQVTENHFLMLTLGASINYVDRILDPFVDKFTIHKAYVVVVSLTFTQVTSSPPCLLTYFVDAAFCAFITNHARYICRFRLKFMKQFLKAGRICLYFYYHSRINRRTFHRRITVL